MRISAQLYTVRNRGDLGDQLQLAAACGYADVETTGLHDLTAPQMARTVAQSGLRVRSAHFDWEEFEGRLPEIQDLLERLECPVAVMPWLAPEARPDTAEGWKAVSGQLSHWATHLSGSGVRLAYHNHDFDLLGYPSQTPLEMILETGNVFWQPDIGWLGAAYLDPVEMIGRYADRVVSVHAKDVDPSQKGDARWRDLGQGDIDWSAVVDALDRTTCSDLFVEHDDSPSPATTLTTGRRFLSDLLKGRI